MKKGIIYKYTFPNGKIYIGQTIDLNKRHYQHQYYAKNAKGNRSLCDVAIAKYGEPKLEVIEEIIGDDNKPYEFKQALNEAEVKWINEFNATDRSVGYNIQHGGHTANEETYILEEIHGNILQEVYAEKIFHVREILDSIIEKVGGDDFVVLQSLKLNKFNLTKEEKEVWFKYKFRDYDGNKITFDSFITQLPICDEFASVVNRVFEMFLMDISKTAWEEIESNKEKYIQDFFDNKI